MQGEKYSTQKEKVNLLLCIVSNTQTAVQSSVRPNGQMCLWELKSQWKEVLCGLIWLESTRTAAYITLKNVTHIGHIKGCRMHFIVRQKIRVHPEPHIVALVERGCL